MSAPDSTQRELSAVTFSVVAARLQAIAVEMGYALKRTSRSLYVKDGEDFCAAVVGVDGLVLAAPDSIGSTLLTLVDVRAAVAAVGGLGPGDVLITNDSFRSGALSTHLADIHVIEPYFDGDTLVGYGWAFIHSSDVGGRVPSSISPLNTDVFQEGLQIPPVKLVKAGVIDPEIEAIIRLNTRTPDANSADIRAMLAALRHGKQAVAALITKVGRGSYLAAAERILARSEERARQLASELPEGTYAFSDFLDDDGITPFPVRLHAAVTVGADGEMTVDFTGTDPQVPSAFNVVTAGRPNPMTTGRVRTTLATLDPDFPSDAGQIRALRVVAPEGTVANAVRPAAVGARHVAGVRFSDVLGGAMFQAAPELMPAAGSGVVIPVVVAERRGGGRGSQVATTLYGGFGGAHGLDGHDGRDNSYSVVASAPVETTEAALHIQVLSYRLLPDSGGAGRWRGGAGREYVFRIEADGTQVLARGLDRFVFRPWGVNGGAPGRAMEVVVNEGLPGERRLRKFDVLELDRGDTMTFRTPGGGGFGPAHERDVEAVLRDVRLGLVSPEAARSEYGVVLDFPRPAEGGPAPASGVPVLDVGATAALRARMGEDWVPSTFSYGPEREAWDAVFTESWYQRFNAALLALPASERAPRRSAVFGAVLAGLPEDFPVVRPASSGGLEAARAVAQCQLESFAPGRPA